MRCPRLVDPFAYPRPCLTAKAAFPGRYASRLPGSEQTPYLCSFPAFCSLPKILLVDLLYSLRQDAVQNKALYRFGLAKSFPSVPKKQFRRGKENFCKLSGHPARLSALFWGSLVCTSIIARFFGLSRPFFKIFEKIFNFLLRAYSFGERYHHSYCMQAQPIVCAAPPKTRNSGRAGAFPPAPFCPFTAKKALFSRARPFTAAKTPPEGGARSKGLGVVRFDVVVDGGEI